MENLFQEQKPFDQIISSVILISYEAAKSQDRHKLNRINISKLILS